MKALIAFAAVALSAGSALAVPPTTMPWSINGQLILGTGTVVEYRAKWNDVLEGYRLAVPPDVGVLSVDEFAVATWTVGEVTATADWSLGWTGVPIGPVNGATFIPTGHDMGYSIDSKRVGRMISWGFVGGIMIDIVFGLIGSVLGGTMKEAGDIASDD